MNAWAFPESDELGKASPAKKAYSLAFGAGYANACGRPLFDQLAPETEKVLTPAARAEPWQLLRHCNGLMQDSERSGVKRDSIQRLINAGRLLDQRESTELDDLGLMRI